MTVYTYVGFALFPKKEPPKPEPKKGKQDKGSEPPREQTWKEGSKKVFTGALIGGGAGSLIGGVSSAIKFRKLVRSLMASNPNLTKEQAEDIVRREHSIGKGIADGFSTGVTIGGGAAYLGNDLKAYKHDRQQNKKSGK